MFVRSPFVRWIVCGAWWTGAAAFAQRLPSTTNESTKNVSEASPVAQSYEAVSDSPGPAEDGEALRRLAERFGGVFRAEVPPALPQELLRPDGLARSEPTAVEPPPPATSVAGTPPQAEPSAVGHSLSAVGAVEPAIEDRPLGPAPRATEGGEVTAAAGDGASSSGWIVKTLGALAVVIGLIFVVRSALGRVAGSMTSSAFSPAVEVLSRVTVAPRNHILLVRLGKRVLVLGDSSAGLRRLADITEPDEVAGVLAAVSAGKPNSISRGFGQLLERFNRDYRPEEEWAEEGGNRHEHAVDRARDQVGSLLSRVRALSGRGGGR